MTQFIAPNMAAAMQYSNQQGMMPSNQYASGILSMADGGFIGGGSIQGQAMPGGRTGFGLFKKIKRAIKKLIPKEAAGIMQVAAPFVAPHSMLGAAALSGLGQYKSRGKINPLQLAMSVAPGLTRGNLSSMTGGRFGVEGSNENLLRNLMRRVPGGEAFDTTLFGEGPKVGRLDAEWMTPKQPFEAAIAPTKGWLGQGGEYGGITDLLKKGTEAVLMKGKPGERVLDKTAVIALGLGGMSYAEAKKQFQLAGQGDLEDDYGITEDVWEATDWEQAFKDNKTLGGNAEGGLPRARHAMGSAQFPPQKRTGLQWGSDKGEGLGGEEVEADMRYTGGFMPYGDKPKADDVPARLSKDEFVFTDEAVAGMGEGDVNLGAERLYNMMKNLEQQGAPGQMGIGAMV